VRTGDAQRAAHARYSRTHSAAGPDQTRMAAPCVDRQRAPGCRTRGRHRPHWRFAGSRCAACAARFTSTISSAASAAQRRRAWCP
jgi:hypothetical protein